MTTKDIISRFTMWFEKRQKVRFLKRNGWVVCGDWWRYETILSPKKLRTLDEAVEHEKDMQATT